MGYAHINNLYKDQTILLFRECWALEKVHGTSAHLRWDGISVILSSGGENAVRFAALFDLPLLASLFEALGHTSVTVYGEAYGGSQQKQAWRYGERLRFVAFDVQVGGLGWLNVPDAAKLVQALGLEFVRYERSSTDLSRLDELRDQPSTQAKRNGVEGDKPQEGVVLRPLVEMLYRGERICAKHKRPEERETASPRPVVDPSKLEVLTQATAIANEWVTETRLDHVLDKIPGPHEVSMTGTVITAMVADVLREGAGEIVDTKDARVAIGRRAAELFRKRVTTVKGPA